VVTKSGIDVVPTGTAEQDWVVESRYHDRLLDDRVVLYLKSTAKLQLLRNATRDTDPLGEPAKGQGRITYKLDRDEQAGEYVGDQTTGTRYTVPIDLRQARDPDHRSVLGSFGSNGKPYGKRPQDTTERFHRGLRDAAGDEWHVLTAWDDDSAWFRDGPNGKVRGSDGIVLPMVVDPKAPVLRLSVADAGDQFYTTPAKTYHTPRLHEQVSYVTPGVCVHLYNLHDDRPVRFRVQDGDWHTYDGEPFPIGRHLHAEDVPVRFELRIGDDGPIRSRTFHLQPSFPSAREHHPTAMLWDGEPGLTALRERLRGGSELPSTAYRALRDFPFYHGLDREYGNGKRHGWKDYEQQAGYALANAFTGWIEPERFRFENGARGRYAKRILLNLFTVDPVGHENTLWWPNPALERVLLGLEQMYFMEAAAAYDLLAGGFRTDQGFADGLTPIEDLLVTVILINFFYFTFNLK
jgi:hypothetical protein